MPRNVHLMYLIRHWSDCCWWAFQTSGRHHVWEWSQLLHSKRSIVYWTLLYYTHISKGCWEFGAADGWWDQHFQPLWVSEGLYLRSNVSIYEHWPAQCGCNVWPQYWDPALDPWNTWWYAVSVLHHLSCKWTTGTSGRLGQALHPPPRPQLLTVVPEKALLDFTRWPGGEEGVISFG